MGLVFDHVAIEVSDLDRAAAFYGGALGLPETENLTRHGHIRWFQAGDRAIHLITGRAGAASASMQVHVAFATDDFDGLIARLDRHGVAWGDSKGVRASVRRRADGARQIFFQDPDGYWLEVNDGG